MTEVLTTVCQARQPGQKHITDARHTSFQKRKLSEQLRSDWENKRRAENLVSSRPTGEGVELKGKVHDEPRRRAGPQKLGNRRRLKDQAHIPTVWASLRRHVR